MVFVKYHEEKVKVNGLKITKRDIERLKKRLKKLGWTNLKWCSANRLHHLTERSILIGCPPNYSGNVSDYFEDVVRISEVHEKPLQDSEIIKIRDYLKGPIFESPRGISWN